MFSNSRKSKGFRAGVRKLLGSTEDTSNTPSSRPPNSRLTSASSAGTGSLASSSSPVQSSSTSSVAANASTKNDESTAWTGLNIVLLGIVNYSDLVPPLKILFSGLRDCVDALSEVDKHRREYSQLASDLATTLSSLSQHLRKSASTEMSQSVQNLISAIQDQIKYITTKQQRRKLSRYAQAIEDGDDLIECYRRIETYFRQLQVDAVMSIWSNTNEQLATMRLDRLAPAMQARYNSAQAVVVRRRTCTPNTRTKVLIDIHDWANKPNTPKVYWLNGMAGTGKTTIAYTLSDELKKTCQLGASFFCSGLLPECRDVSRILPTISYQLAGFSSAFRSALCKALGDDRDLSSYDIDTQFHKLIRDPLLAVKETLSTNILVVIDALDELSNSSDAPMVLDLLFRYAMDLPIKFFATSRPEPGIREKILSRDSHSRSVLYLHDIEQSLVEADIETYLKDELKSISPSETQIQQLAVQAGSLFIYAATAVRYILPDSISVDPHRRLKTMLEMSSSPSSKKHVAIDALYTAILTRALENTDLEPEEADDIRLILNVAICVKEPLSMGVLANLLGLGHERRVTLALQPLQSVLNVYESTGIVSTLHASFPDYMLNQGRSGTFYCNKTRLDSMIAERCFHTMRQTLRFNICNLETSYLLDRNVPNLQDRVSQFISQELFYSCRYWGVHLLGADISGTLSYLLGQFLSSCLLFWMEVLNLKKYIGVGEAILYDGQKWLEKCGIEHNTRELLKDARKFVTYFAANPAGESTPHIYISSLTFWRKTSPVSRKYWGSTRGLVYVDEKVINKGGSALMATWQNNARVLSVAFSPDGVYIASGCYDCTIRVWDAQTGAIFSDKFQGHTYGVTSVAFSPDGFRIVSGSYDRSLRLWDTQTGAAVCGPIQGHTNAVTSVAFSSDGAYIISGSWDNTIRMWDANDGTMVHDAFRGHTSGVTSVAFFSDGTRIVSGSRDNTICVWDAQTGAVVSSPFDGHTDEVTSIALSPDGVLIASGSMDNTIRLWDVQTGTMISRPFEGHNSLVISVAFSPDGTRIVSGSSDQTIRVWDVKTGAMVSGPFQGHNSAVSTVAFSPDGDRVVSGSDDETVRVWDSQSGSVATESFQGHTSPVTSVAFSKDSTRIVSGAEDCTISVWDTQTGTAVFDPFEAHTQPVTSVAFSPDGAYVASGSNDRTIRVWDAQTGGMVSGPFEGHDNLVSTIAFSPDNACIASGSYDHTIRVWDIKTGTVICGPFRGHTHRVTSIAFSSDGTRIVSGSGDDTIRVWDVQTGTSSDPFTVHDTEVTSVAFSLDGALIVSGSRDNSIRLWDAHTGNMVSGPFKVDAHVGPVESVAISPDGARIVSGSWDGSVHVWNAYGESVACSLLQGHIQKVAAVAFSQDGTRIVSCSEDTTIRVWDALYTGTATIDDWHMNGNGWITDGPEEKLIVWVPPELRSGLYRPRNTLVICARGSFRLDFNNTSHGTHWHECYVGQE